MATPVLTSISPVSGAPGTVIALTGSGFDPTARVGCPDFVATTFVSSTSLTAAIPSDLEGPEGESMLVSVFVLNADSSVSAVLTFTVKFPFVDLQTWTSIALVAGEVPGFVRNTNVTDAQILNWMKTVAQTVAGMLLKRGLPLDPTQWTQADPSSAMPSPVGVLEQIVRLGAAARLAGVISAQFSGGGEWGLSKSLNDAFAREWKLLGEGVYDKLFLPTAATIAAGPLFSGDNATTADGCSTQAFQKGRVF